MNTILGTGTIARMAGRINPTIAVMAVCATIVGGCAAITSSSNQQIASKAQSNVEAIKECAAEAGVTAESAAAKDPADRSGAEHALLVALDLERQINSASSRSTGAQASLDNRLPRQAEAQAELDRVNGLLDLFRPKINFFNTKATEMMSIADALARLTDDSNETSNYRWDGDITVVERRALSVIGIAGILTAPLGIGILIGDILGTDRKKNMLREKQVSVANELLASLQEMQGLMNDNGYSAYAGDLDGPIGGIQHFLGTVANPDRDVNPRPMLDGMLQAVTTYNSLSRNLQREHAAAQTIMDGIAQSTQRNFATLNKAEADLKDALKRSQAALEACRSFPDTPGNIDWQRTWWLISSP